MLDKRGKKRIFALLMAIALVVSTLAVDVLGSTAAELKYRESYDGADVVSEYVEDKLTVNEADAGSFDGTDTGSNDGSDVSDSDVSGNSQPIQTEAFLVTDSKGAIFDAYDNWDALVAGFASKGDAGQAYVISVLPTAVIGKKMPSQAAEITLKAADEKKSELYFATGTVNMTTPLIVDAKTLCVADADKMVNINTKGKKLTLIGIQKAGTVKGNSKARLSLIGDVSLQGNLQSFRTVTVTGTVRVSGNISSVTNLILEKGIVYLVPGKKFTVTNVDATAGGALGFPAEGKLPTAKISGKVDGILALKQFREQDGNYVEQEFAAGSKLLTASKATVERFALKGEKQVCYKKGSVLYVGAEVLELYKGEEHLGTYAQWNDIKAKINDLQSINTSYRVVLLDDYVVNGSLSMPTKGRYAGIVLQNGKGAPVILKATGNLSMTADLVLESEITLEAKQISGAAWTLTAGENCKVNTTGNLTVKSLHMGKNVKVKTAGKLTVKAVLQAAGKNEIVLPYKKAASIKDTVTDERICLKLTDKSGNRVGAVANTIVMNVTGNSYATQYCLLDDKDAELGLYRKGNGLRVKGAVATPISLSYMDGQTQVSLGEYATLADVKTEISRRKIKEGVYAVHVGEAVLVKGAFPLPKAGTYKAVTFTGEKIRITGSITLTGDVSIYNELERIKSEQDVSALPITAKLAKYTLTISEKEIKNLTTVTGSTGSGLTIGTGVQQVIEGNLAVDKLTLGDRLQVKGDLTVTDIYPQKGNQLDYDLTKKIVIKGNVHGTENKLLLNPLRNGQSITYVEDMKVLPDAPKVSVSSVMLAKATDWVLYRESGAVLLGKPYVTVFEDTQDYGAAQNADGSGKQRFARVTDAVEYVNTLDGTEYVIRLDADISSADSLKSPAKGKKIIVCSVKGERKKMGLSGSVVVDEGSLSIRDVVLDNGKANGPGVILINGAQLHLYNMNVNTITAPANTAVTLEGEVDINGSIAGACDLTVMENAVVRADSTISINSLTLLAAAKGTSQLRLQVDKKMNVSNNISTPEEGQFIINRVDKNDELAELGKGTVMLTAPYGQSIQFKTQNIMPGTFMEWSLIKIGNDIKTSEASQGDGEWSGDFL